jgi:hypothetical protein
MPTATARWAPAAAARALAAGLAGAQPSVSTSLALSGATVIDVRGAGAPPRFRGARPQMLIPAAVEKFSFVTTLIVLYQQGRVQLGQLAVAGPDLVLGVLFIAAHSMIGEAQHRSGAWCTQSRRVHAGREYSKACDDSSRLLSPIE